MERFNSSQVATDTWDLMGDDVMILSGVVAGEKVVGGGGGGPHKPLVSEFTQVNVAGSTLIDDVDALQFQIQDSIAVNWRLLVQPSPFAPPYNAKMKFYYSEPGPNSSTCGMYFVDASNAMAGLEQVVQASVGNTLRVQHNSSPTSPGATPWTDFPSPWGASQANTAPVWIRLRNDGTTLFYDYSNDGSTWVNAYSETISASGLTAPIGIGIGGITIIGSGVRVILHAVSLDYGANATF